MPYDEQFKEWNYWATRHTTFPLVIQVSPAFQKFPLVYLAFMEDLHLVPVFTSLTESIPEGFLLFMKKGVKKK